MDVKGIGKNLNPLQETYGKRDLNQNQNDESKVNSDKLEISSEARKLQSKNVSPQDIALIKERINSKYYDSDEVISKVVDAILNEFNQN